MFGQFTHLVSEASGWAYGIVFLLAFLDVLVPVVPSEASVITAGVVASAGGLYLPLIIVAAACGAFLGDNTAYLVGRRFGTRATQRFLHGGKGEKTLAWAERQLTRRGGELIVVSASSRADGPPSPWPRARWRSPAALRGVRCRGGPYLGFVRVAARVLRRTGVRE